MLRVAADAPTSMSAIPLAPAVTCLDTIQGPAILENPTQTAAPRSQSKFTPARLIVPRSGLLPALTANPKRNCVTRPDTTNASGHKQMPKNDSIKALATLPHPGTTKKPANRGANATSQ